MKSYPNELVKGVSKVVVAEVKVLRANHKEFAALFFFIRTSVQSHVYCFSNKEVVEEIPSFFFAFLT